MSGTGGTGRGTGTGTGTGSGTGPARRRVLRTAGGVVLGGTLDALVAADSARPESGLGGRLRIAAGEPAGLYYEFGQLLATQLRAVSPRLECRTLATDASVANLRLVHHGGAEVAITLADTAWAALTGAAPFGRPLPLRALGRVYENYIQLVVRADSPVRTLAGLAGHTLSLGAPGSGAAVTGGRLLRAAGLTPGAGIRVRHLSMSDAQRALVAGTIDAMLVAGGVPLTILARLDAGFGIRLLPLGSFLPALRSPAPRRPAPNAAVYHRVTVPHGTYRAVDAVSTIGVPNLLMCRPDLPDAVAAGIVRVLVGRAGRLVPAQAAGAQFLDIRSLIDTAGTPLHRGAAAAYRELHG
ncbi:TAXI family TRAP transporter solute-binding subunit [Streptomyces sp. NPDC087850]|uniref:TAXI family TRAP transporter solute-binding subunit n=1 Tax=Streptomyces sp. NPDC087850 TaxID=3365809 RepID=UPI00382C1586